MSVAVWIPATQSDTLTPFHFWNFFAHLVHLDFLLWDTAGG